MRKSSNPKPTWSASAHGWPTSTAAITSGRRAERRPTARSSAAPGHSTLLRPRPSPATRNRPASARACPRPKALHDVSLSYLVLLAALLLARPKGNRLGEALRLLPDVLRLLRRLASDSDVLRTARVRLWLLLADLAIPFDLVPDFVPVLGYADDAIIVSLVLRSVVRRTGAPVIRRLWPGTKDELAALCLTGFPSVSRCRARRESRRLRRRRGRGRRRRDRAHRCSCFRQGRKHAIRIGPSRCAPVAASSIAITRLEILTRQLESPSRDLGRGTSRQQARGGGPRGRRAGPAC
jgi:uncharacterized membrane protein YkvA (DUF1232 family)